MTVNNLIEAIASKLTELWPDRKVHVDEIPKGADGNFFVDAIETSQEKLLDRRRKRSYQFEVLYFLRSDDNMAFNEWAESMYDHFEFLNVAESAEKMRCIFLTEQAARKDETGVFQFTFDATFNFITEPLTIDPMEKLNIKEALK